MGLFNWFKKENDGMVKMSKKEQKRIAKREHEARCYKGTHKVQNYMKLNVDEQTWCLPYVWEFKIALNKSEKELKDVHVYKFSDIISYDLEVNSQSVASGGLGRAVAGGVLFGGTGAIVGVVTGGKKTKTKVKGGVLKITVNSFDKPVEVLIFDEFNMTKANECVTYLELMVKAVQSERGNQYA